MTWSAWGVGVAVLTPHAAGQPLIDSCPSGEVPCCCNASAPRADCSATADSCMQ